MSPILQLCDIRSRVDVLVRLGTPLWRDSRSQEWRLRSIRATPEVSVSDESGALAFQLACYVSPIDYLYCDQACRAEDVITGEDDDTAEVARLAAGVRYRF